ncbi:MAG TPA: PAS domain S-box protein [Desulfobacteraceae bacterium]|nr:PAS domain S-box protein [Desulfobacteraceae bacterium]
MPNIKPFSRCNSDEVKLLTEAIDCFNGAAFRFEKYYQDLEKRVRELDIELKEKNRALQKNLKEKEDVKNHLHNILESLSTGVIVLDLQGRINIFNRTAEEITGFISKKIVGRGYDDIFSMNYFLNSRLNFAGLKGFDENADMETEIHGKGNKLLHIRLSISPVKNARGGKIGIVLMLQDITKIKRLEEQASRNDRLAAMGEMAVKIAHEIRNPLGSIELFASMLKKDLEEFGDLNALAGYISSGVKSINNIISNLLLFIRPQQQASFRIIDIREIIDDSLFFSSHLTKSVNGIEVVRNFYPDPLMVRGDSELLKQVLLNLILNAFQAMTDGGTLTISTTKMNGRPRGHNFAELRFADTGAGISRGDLLRVFDPFFTTKNTGTGLGLAIVHNLTKIHGGTVDIISSEGKGTECILTFPLWEDGENN